MAWTTGYIPRSANGYYYYRNAGYPYGVRTDTIPYDGKDYRIPLGSVTTGGGLFWVFHLVWYYDGAQWHVEQSDVSSYVNVFGTGVQISHILGWCAT